MGQQGTHGEGEENTHPAGHDGGDSLPIELLVIEFHPDQEEEQYQADRGKGFKRAEGTGRKETGGKMGGKTPENGRANKDSADDLTDHARLADF
jgi:hypothetical protein